MSGEERRHELLDLLSASREPISGRHLADHFKVSRQVIVQDIALLRANGLQDARGASVLPRSRG